MLQEIKDIYNYRREDNSPMLSPYEPSGDIDFWKPYRDNFAYFDRMFMKKYRSWFPMDQEGDIEEVSVDFAYDVKSWLMINNKRYAELFRMQSIPDDNKYSLTDNVYENETVGKTTSNSGTFTKGSEQITDSGTNIYGAQSNSDSISKTFASQADSESKSKTFGQQIIDHDTSETIGATQKTITNSTSAYNESGYSDTDKSVEAETARSNSTNVDITNGSHTDSETNSYTHGAHTDTESNSYTLGSHTDTISNTRTDGQRIDTNSGTGSESITRERSGNIGVRTVDEMLTIHKDTWVDFSFFEIIFADIARELLRGVI